MTKVKYFEVTIRPIEAEMPKACPSCKARIEDVDGFELAGRSLTGGAVLRSGDIDWSYGENQYDPNYLITIACRMCGWFLFDGLKEG